MNMSTSEFVLFDWVVFSVAISPSQSLVDEGGAWWSCVYACMRAYVIIVFTFLCFCYLSVLQGCLYMHVANKVA